MRIYRRPKSDYWWFDLSIDGKRLRRSTKRIDRREAEQVATAVATEQYDAAQLGRLPPLPLAGALSRLLSESRMNRDQSGMETRARKLVAGKGFEGRYGLNPSEPLHVAVTSDTIARLRAKRLDEGAAPGTINREVALAQRLWNLARMQWGVQVAPNVSFPKYAVRGKLRYLTVEEEGALLHELDPMRLMRFQPPLAERSEVLQHQLRDQRDLVIFLLDTGCRYGEAARLTWDCVDTKAWETINIYRWKVGNEGVLAMTARLRSTLRTRWEAQEGPYVFPGYGETRNQPRGHATGGIMKAYDRAGLNEPHKVERFGKATIHSLRDTFASRLIQNGLDIAKVSKLMGHATLMQTAKYSHLIPSDDAATAASILDDLTPTAKPRLRLVSGE